MADADPFAFDCTPVVAQTTIAAQTTVAIQTVAELLVVPPMDAVVVSASFDGLLPSHSTCPFFCPAVYHMHDNPYLHAQQIDKMCRLNLSTSWPSSAYNHNLHVDSHKLGRYTPWHTAIT